MFQKRSDPLENVRFVQLQGMFREGQPPIETRSKAKRL